MSARWTKTDLRTLRSQIDGFALFNGLYHSPEAIRSAIEAERLAIVLDGLRSFRETLRDRAERNRGASEHFAANPGIYGDSTPEMIERFAGLAAGDERAVARLDRLLVRVEVDGLPEGVVDYVPESLR